ncbi:DUF6886 family protein, partial [Jatrophihabitans endophyticus]|uniref:DUF6886 family protein n=1 Tax=Jatrophihabitans endophyticus TaxID=1206085 RepID=UPI001A1084BB
NYLLPRECPRVCWQVGKHEDGILASSAPRVVAIEQRWLARSTRAGLLVHQLAPDGFRLADSAAGYWTSSQMCKVVGVERVDDCPAELARHKVELRITDTLWPYVDAVSRSSAEFSVIRIRNAMPRPT